MKVMPIIEQYRYNSPDNLKITVWSMQENAVNIKTKTITIRDVDTQTMTCGCTVNSESSPEGGESGRGVTPPLLYGRWQPWSSACWRDRRTAAVLRGAWLRVDVRLELRDTWRGYSPIKDNWLISFHYALTLTQVTTRPTDIEGALARLTILGKTRWDANRRRRGEIFTISYPPSPRSETMPLISPGSLSHAAWW